MGRTCGRAGEIGLTPIGVKLGGVRSGSCTHSFHSAPLRKVSRSQQRVGVIGGWSPASTPCFGGVARLPAWMSLAAIPPQPRCNA